jgi:hypothetical protein
VLFRSVLPWDEQPELICVDVEVVVPNWVIYPSVLTPGFEDTEDNTEDPTPEE